MDPNGLALLLVMLLCLLCYICATMLVTAIASIVWLFAVIVETVRKRRSRE